MQRHFYACVKEMPFDVAIFGSRRARDRWVNFKDDFSQAFPDDEALPRISLSAKEARFLVGSKLHKKNLHHPDSILDGVSWVFRWSNPIGGILA